MNYHFLIFADVDGWFVRNAKSPPVKTEGLPDLLAFLNALGEKATTLGK